MLNIINHQGNAKSVVMGHHLTPIRMATIKKKTNQKIISVDEDIEKLEPLNTWWECKMIQLLWKTVWQFLWKLKVELPHTLTIPLQGIYSK